MMIFLLNSLIFLDNVRYSLEALHSDASNDFQKCFHMDMRKSVLPFKSSLLVVTCDPLINFTNSMDPHQVLHNVGPDLYPNCVPERFFLKS